MSAAVTSLRELEALSLEPSWADLDPECNRVLVVSANELAGSGARASELCHWLRSQPVPVLALGVPPPEWMDAFDTWFDCEDALARAVAQIEARPSAAAVTAQVLRATLSLSWRDALALESLGYATLQGGRDYAAWRRGRPARSVTHDAEVPLRVERDGAKVRLVMCAPVNRNALSAVMRDALSDAFRLVLMDEAIQQVHWSAEGPVFCAGGDLSEFSDVRDVALSHRIRTLRMPAQYLAPRRDIVRVRVHGACIGAGIELPAFAGRISAHPDTLFQLPELAMGLLPGAGGCVSIPRRIGRHRTGYMVFLGERFSAQQALSWGLIDAIED